MVRRSARRVKGVTLGIALVASHALGAGEAPLLGEAPPEPPAPPTTCTPGVPATSQIPRLTNEQYDNTVRDLIGLDTNPSAAFPPDYEGDILPDSWAAYQGAAETLAAKFIEDETARDKFLPCFEESDTCVDRIITEFGLRAYRRPLTAQEVAGFQEQYDNRAEYSAAGSFEDAIQLMVETFLISPTFLTRAELSTASRTPAA
jgi:hypothetical protein